MLVDGGDVVVVLGCVVASVVDGVAPTVQVVADDTWSLMKVVLSFYSRHFYCCLQAFNNANA